MIEKVNPAHPDKVADRIAGALVDLAYGQGENPKIAVEVLIGHGTCHIIAETSEQLNPKAVDSIVKRIAGRTIETDYVEVPQDVHLAENQAKEGVRCGDNGIFKGVRKNDEEELAEKLARDMYGRYNSDGKYIVDSQNKRVIICQSNTEGTSVMDQVPEEIRGYEITVNPLGDWTGGTDVDTGATNRKLGSDMGRAVTGGGLHGKDLSKADVSVNIFCHRLAQAGNSMVEASCAIGDESVDFTIHQDSHDWHMNVPYWLVVAWAADYVYQVGGFEELAKWGLQ